MRTDARGDRGIGLERRRHRGGGVGLYGGALAPRPPDQLPRHDGGARATDGRSAAQGGVRGRQEEDAMEQPASPSEMIDRRIEELVDWRGRLLAAIRAIIRQADPDVVEEWKWRGVPTWYHGGIICTGETYKDKVKMTFAKGASLEDPTGLFNASLQGNARRAIDLYEGDEEIGRAHV